MHFFSLPSLLYVFSLQSISLFQTVLTRKNTITGVEYRNDPTIFAWELINEPRCMSDPSGDTLQVSCKLLVLFISLLQSTIEDSTPSNFNQTLKWVLWVSKEFTAFLSVNSYLIFIQKLLESNSFILSH